MEGKERALRRGGASAALWIEWWRGGESGQKVLSSDEKGGEARGLGKSNQNSGHMKKKKGLEKPTIL